MSDLWLPFLATEQGVKIDQMLIILHVLMLVLFVGWGSYLAYALIRFRKSRNPVASYEGTKSKSSSYAELVVAVCEALILVCISIPFWATKIDALPAPETNPLEVRVIAQQFAWNVHYPGADGIFGSSKVELVNEQSNPLGIDPNDSYGKDDITTINQLYLPVDRPVVVHLSTKDVIHSFGVPEFRVKQDAIPGMSIPMSFVPTVTTEDFRAVLREEAAVKFAGDEEGLAERLAKISVRTYEIACAQLCGLGHYYMRGFVTVVEEDAFEQWLVDNAPGEEEEYDDFF
jgi:cytochrome c oxidase subunit 2